LRPKALKDTRCRTTHALNNPDIFTRDRHIDERPMEGTMPAYVIAMTKGVNDRTDEDWKNIGRMLG
jgi:hypothetical protein